MNDKLQINAATRERLEALVRKWSEVEVCNRKDFPVAAHSVRLCRDQLNALLREAEPVSKELSFSALREANVRRCEGSFHPLNHWNLMEWGAACAGEVGEACNKAKKLRRLEDSEAFKGTLPKADVTVEDLVDEIADSVIYADLWAAAAGYSLGEAVVRKFNRKSEEVGSGIRLGVGIDVHSL